MCFSLQLNEASGRRIIWAMGQEHPQLSNRLHDGPAATLTSTKPFCHQTDNKHFQFLPGKSGAPVSLVTVPIKAKTYWSC